MNVEITIWSFILLLGTFQALFLILTFNIKRVGLISSRLIMSLLLLCIILITLDHSLRLSNLYKSFPYGLYISDASWYAIAPLIWLFTTTRIGRPIRWSHLAHFLPFLIFAYLYHDLPFASIELKIGILESYLANGAVYSDLVKAFILLMMVQMLVYLIAAFLVLHRYQRLFFDQSSGNEINSLVNLKRLILAFGSYFVFEFIYSTYRNFTDQPNNFIENWSLIMWTLFVILLAWGSINKSHQLFTYIKPIKSKYNGLDLQQLKSKLIDFMENESPYLDSNLTLTKLAQFIDLPAHHLSHLLNSFMHTSFYDFVNVYRVKHVSYLIDSGEDKQYSIFGLAQRCGFKSKASFYAFFKSEYGMTPNNYAKHIKKNRYKSHI